MLHQYAAGLLDDNVEFFASADFDVFCTKSGRVLGFNEFDEILYSLIEQDMYRFPVKMDCLTSMGLTQRLDRIKQYLICNYGGFDLSADVKDGKLTATEYWACPNRGNCPHEGKLCDSLRTDTGNHLTRREIEVLKLIASGEIDKIIADKLKLKLHTVTAHNRNIRVKTGLFRKPDLTRFAIQKNLI